MNNIAPAHIDVLRSDYSEIVRDSGIDPKAFKILAGKILASMGWEPSPYAWVKAACIVSGMHAGYQKARTEGTPRA